MTHIEQSEVPSYRVEAWSGRSYNSCVVIPVINEGDRIERLLKRMKVLGIEKTADVIIVDGGSTDGSLTAALLSETSVAGLLVKTGPGRLSAQLRCAYSFALDQNYQVIVTIDGNDKDDPQPIPDFIKAIESGYDFVQASRFIRGGIEENTPWKRRLAIRWIHAPILSIASGFKWTDTTQGFRAYSRRMLLDPRVAILRKVFVEYELLSYLSYRIPRLGYRCIELPTIRRYPADKAVPTKISSFYGEFSVLMTLLKTCFGYFNPKS